MAIVKAILLEPIRKLGKTGDVVKVRRGFFRYLFVLKKVSYATETEIKRLETEKENLRIKDEMLHAEAVKNAAQLEGKTILISNPASEKGMLYGAISSRQISQYLLEKENLFIHPNQISLPQGMKKVGVYKITLDMHHAVQVSMNVEIVAS